MSLLFGNKYCNKIHYIPQTLARNYHCHICRLWKIRKDDETQRRQEEEMERQRRERAEKDRERRRQEERRNCCWNSSREKDRKRKNNRLVNSCAVMVSDWSRPLSRDSLGISWTEFWLCMTTVRTDLNQDYDYVANPSKARQLPSKG